MGGGDEGDGEMWKGGGGGRAREMVAERAVVFIRFAHSQESVSVSVREGVVGRAGRVRVARGRKGKGEGRVSREGGEGERDVAGGGDGGLIRTDEGA